MTGTKQANGPDSRPARRAAIGAAVLWASALVATVGLSTWLGSLSLEPVWGVPGWAFHGVFGPWALFFFLHMRFFRRRWNDSRR